MIEITPDIIGPGIEEEYADALDAIGEIESGLAPVPLTNSTPDGRLLLNLRWIRQQIVHQTLPIPVDRSFVGVVHYLVGSGEVSSLPDLLHPVQPSLERLSLVLKGYGLMKPRHVPVLISMIDDLVADARRCWSDLHKADRDVIEDLTSLAEDLRRGGSWPKQRRPQDYPSAGPALTACVENVSNRLRMVNASLFEGWRPYPASKPPLAAPVPGLPPEAPPLPPELEGKLP